VADVEFLGEHFKLRKKLPQYALMKFAKSAQSVEANTLDALGSMLNLLQKCIAAEDWDRFDALADEEQPDMEDLFAVISKVFEEATDRPTGLPSVSSDGPSGTQLRSVSPPADPATEMLSSRPDARYALKIARGEILVSA
jgi:hypothetical protein